MYGRTVSRPKQRRSQVRQFPAPIAGWIANRALALPGGEDERLPQGAAILDNFICRASSVEMRRGKRRYCTLGDGSLPATSIFSYNNGSVRKLFASNENTIYDVTVIGSAYNQQLVDHQGSFLSDGNGNTFGWGSTTFVDQLTGFTGGEWSVVQFATTGGVYLVGVNGVDDGFIFDGEDMYPITENGVWVLHYDDEIESFTEGEVVTGTTSGATGTIWRVMDMGGGEGRLVLTDVTGDFEDNETITDGDDGEATVNGAVEEALPDLPGMQFGDLTSADMAFVWIYRNRLYFAQRDSMNAWYLDVDSIGGEAEIFPLAGMFQLGGVLLFGQRWSLSSSGEGGLSEQCIFASSEGEIVIFQGSDPEGQDWNQVGTYRIGKPLGRRGFIRGAGDLAIATSVGLVPLSKAIELDTTALSVATISYPIADAWGDAVAQRGSNWVGEVWPEERIAVFSPPQGVGVGQPVVFVANTETGAWSRFTGWEGLSMDVFEGRLFFGESNGAVYAANETGFDDGAAYTAVALPLFDDFDAPASIKIAKVGRYILRATTALNPVVGWHGDYDETMPAAPDATEIESDSTWGTATWGTSTWGADFPTVVSVGWQSLGGSGYTGSVSCQITSGSLLPIDAEIISSEVLYDVADAVS